MSDTTNINDLLTDPVGSSKSENITIKASDHNDLNKSNVNGVRPMFNQPTSDKSLGINLDESTINQIISGLQHASNTGITQLPSRDIPMSTNNMVHDPYVQSDYVPPSKNNDYITNDYSNEDIIHNYNKNQNRISSIDEIYNEIQIPLLMSILYFIFQLPFIRKFMFSNMPFLFNVDGNLNLKGLVFKSLLYGGVYYFLSKTSKTFSKF
jgi:hypothetical protein